MSEQQPTVLWVDEDQGEWPIVAMLISESGAKCRPAFNVDQGVKALNELQPNDIIILDAIVRAKPSEHPSLYPGIDVWRRLTPAQRNRTLVVSVVPRQHLVDAKFDVPEVQFFRKLDLGLSEYRKGLQQKLQELLQPAESHR